MAQQKMAGLSSSTLIGSVEVLCSNLYPSLVLLAERCIASCQLYVGLEMLID